MAITYRDTVRALINGSTVSDLILSGTKYSWLGGFEESLDDKLADTSAKTIKQFPEYNAYALTDQDYVTALDANNPNHGEGDGELSFTIQLPNTIKNAHLKGIGAAFGADPKHLLKGYWDLTQGSLAVFPPTLPNLLDNSVNLLRQPIVLSDVRLRDARITPKTSTSGYWINASPEGNWTIKIIKLFGLPVINGVASPNDVDDGISRSSSMVQNIFLYLNLRAQTDGDPKDWSTLIW